MDKAQLKARLHSLSGISLACFDNITEQNLLNEHTVQCYRESGISILSM